MGTNRKVEVDSGMMVEGRGSKEDVVCRDESKRGGEVSSKEEGKEESESEEEGELTSLTGSNSKV